MSIRSLVNTVVLGASLAATVACVAPRGRVYVRIAPPVPIVEARVVAPGPGYVWVPGYYALQRGAYVWLPGRYVLPPRARAVWIAPHWEHERRGWFFVEGHWR
ncbi:MAG TPA: YXWGXW repeat-containing protein [Vicinamibacterales bacterium]|nr:YXWGXW repeat-containing protein [Vicinamibacterales bacterium]